MRLLKGINSGVESSAKVSPLIGLLRIYERKRRHVTFAN